MSHTNKFTRNARLRRFAPGSAPAENNISPIPTAPQDAFVGYANGRPPPPPPGQGIRIEPAPSPAGCQGAACLAQVQQPRGVRFVAGRLTRFNNHLEVGPHPAYVNVNTLSQPHTFKKIPKKLRVYPTPNNENLPLLKEQEQTGRQFDYIEEEARKNAEGAAIVVKVRGGSIKNQTNAYLQELEYTLKASGLNTETVEIILEGARKERSFLDPQVRSEIIRRRKVYRERHKTKTKKKNNGYEGNGNARTRKIRR
jgi:hypothetical protein